MIRNLFFAALVLLASSQEPPDRNIAVPMAAVASGREYWINAQSENRHLEVDIGTLRQVGDEIVVRYRQRLAGERLTQIRVQHKPLNIPSDSQMWGQDKIFCGDVPAQTTEKRWIISPSGVVIFSEAVKPVHLYNQTYYHNFLSDREVAGMVCWLAAKKCEGKDARWPPPKLLYDQWGSVGGKGQKMSDFIPACRLPK